VIILEIICKSGVDFLWILGQPEACQALTTITVSMKSLALVCFLGISLVSRVQAAVPQVMISNLDQLWTSGGMGNFETVLPGYGYGFLFDTGASPYTLDRVTFEELGGPGTVQVQIYAAPGDPLPGSNPNLVLVGALGNPVVDPRPTQWPGYTSFIDYTPVSSITLAPNAYYLITATEPVNGNDATALTFNFNYSYTVSADWYADPDSTYQYLGSNPIPNPSGWAPAGSAGSIMVEVDATPVPEPSALGLLAVGATALLVRPPLLTEKCRLTLRWSHWNDEFRVANHE